MRKIFLFVILSFQSAAISSQVVLTKKKNDFTPIESFLDLADSFEAGLSPASSAWAEYFSIPTVQLFSQAPGFDSSTFRSDMKLIFFRENPPLEPEKLTQQQRQLLAYKDHQQLIRSVIKKIKTENIEDSIKLLLFPYLPKSMQIDSILPKQIYLFLDEGNGFPGYVFNSMLQTALVHSFRSGIVSAHESYHALVSSVFMNKLDNAGPVRFTDEEKGLLSFLEQIAEEGMADLIDKQVLGQPGSPFYNEVSSLRQDEDKLSGFFIKKIDSLLTIAGRTGKIPAFEFQDFTKNGGHIPGRFMAQRIRQAGLLSACISVTGDPAGFFEVYQKTAKRGDGPALSATTMAYLKSLRLKYRSPS